MVENNNKIGFHYAGSKGWLLFWVIIFFRVALILFFLNGRFVKGEKTYYIRYNGSQCWLIFWFVAHYPVAFLLLFLNGVTFWSTQNRDNLYTNKENLYTN
ncbi:hypothetical protein EDM02_00250 [Candidatus Cardinium hertigii]|jgi:predicted permease|uniref:Uncharacterized protein n=1 Tax=Candidatus Cardinium hertigii TaxID=247481 RepID=A0A3N2QDT0_9BACT|nr:hypothetical protein EDM02_00240 [Candidatus Cardinium hertigii]ROT47821.1 hypothetical protein EDM02_00250 [Candidatus Cardinium hertigii]